MIKHQYYLLIMVFLVALGAPLPGSAEKNQPAELFLTLKRNLVIVRLQVPGSAAPPPETKGESAGAEAARLARLLRYTQGVFQFPVRASCIRRQVNATSIGEVTAVANWVFACDHPEEVTLVRTRLFDLLQLDSIHALVLPGGQHLITPEQPFLPIAER
jgi:hypothetical protein